MGIHNKEETAMEKKWRELGIRTKLLYISAGGAFVSGWALTFWGFNMPPKGEVNNTVIVVLGQAMTYAAAAYGIGEYIQYSIARLKINNSGKGAKDAKDEGDEKVE